MHRRVQLILITALWVLLAVTGVQAQHDVTWDAAFFNNTYLLAPAAYTRSDSTIAFNWGTGAPAPGIYADNFSARWSADVDFTAGTYRFYALADDAVRIYVDFQLLVDTFDSPRVGQIVSGDVTLPAGTHHIQVDYREDSGEAHLFIDWRNLANNPSPPDFAQQLVQSAVTTVNSGTWTAEYFGNSELSGSPALIQSESNPANDWGSGAPGANLPADGFSARWTSTQTLKAGRYELSVRADDGVRVLVDGVAVIDAWQNASGESQSAVLDLADGTHTIVVEYYDERGLASISYQLTRRQSTEQAPPAASSEPPLLTVRDRRLNVRDVPDANNGNIIGVASPGTTYIIVGRNADSTWWQIVIDGRAGWIFGGFANTRNTGDVPVTDGAAAIQPTPTGYTLIAADDVNIRSAPGTRFAVLGTLPAGVAAGIVGRDASARWWQINYNGILGWVSEEFITLQSDLPVQDIPVTW